MLEAAGVLHVTPDLYLMPDNPFLGEFRARFAARLGQLEERPDEAEDKTLDFAGADEVEGIEEFLDDLEDDPRDRVDSRAYLAARLMDLFLGDSDRHADQWRCARFDQPGGSAVRSPATATTHWQSTSGCCTRRPAAPIHGGCGSARNTATYRGC